MVTVTIQQQLELEQEAIDLGKKDYQEALKKHRPLPPHFALLSLVMPRLIAGIHQWKGEAKRGAGVLHTIRPVLQATTTEDLAFVGAWSMITEVSQGVSQQSVARVLGTAVHDHIEYLRFKEDQPRLLASLQNNMKTSNDRHKRRVLSSVAKRVGITPQQWPHEVVIQVGLRMLDFMVNTGYWRLETSGIGTLEVSPAPETTKWLSKAHDRCALMISRFMPTIIPPKPWVSPVGGGYWSGAGSHNLSLVKSRHQEVQEEVAKADLTAVYTAVNALQNTPWRINRKVLDTVEYIWTSTDGLGILDKADSVEHPAKPWNSQKEFEAFKAEHPEEFKTWVARDREAYEEGVATMPKARLTSRVIARARKFKDCEKFYFPWTLDYRGRAYPRPLYMNPQGSDVSRGLLEFATSTTMGEHGAKWLAIHGANTYGEDKTPASDRVRWVKDHELQILASAAAPLDFGFWRDADEPFQFLAFCHEWAGYVASGRSERYETHIPVQVDGSCNGLQHFAGLLRDREGAAAVNMRPATDCDSPSDIYSKVRDVVIRLVAEDLDRPETTIDCKDNTKEVKWSISSHEMARLWAGKIDRGIVKRGVMTRPYGVTSHGLRDQLVAELRKREAEARKKNSSYLGVELKDLWQPALYLANKLDTAINTVVMAASTVMDWFKACADVFNKAKQAMKWVTPTGFVAVQKYVAQKSIWIWTYRGRSRTHIRLLTDTPKIDTAKQKAGASPNIIHSLDAAHLILTVLRGSEHGVRNWSMIHDSYGCPPGQMEVVAGDLRQVFSEMYSQDLLMNLYRQWKEQLPPELADTLPLPPATMDLEVSFDAVQKWLYFYL